MLVLRRRVGESISIAGDIEIEIIEISRSRVKLGVTAPRTVAVMRKEVLRAAEDNQKASRLAAAVPPQVIEALQLLSKHLSEKS